MVGAMIDIETPSQVREASQELFHFSRNRDAKVMPKLRKIEAILNHFRIISIEAFRFIPQFDLRDVYGRYYKSRLIVSMILLEMISLPRSDSEMVFLARRNAEVWNIPRKGVVVSHHVKLRVQEW